MHREFRATLTAAVMLLSAPAEAQQSAYGPWAYPYPGGDAVWTESNINTVSAAMISDNNNGRLTYSPAKWYSLSSALKYNSGAFVIAHRGLVNLWNGIPENSEAAVFNAVNHGVYLVEIDVQATKDSVAVPLHDLSLLRPFGIDQNVDQVDYSTISGRLINIQNPLAAISSATRRYSPNTTAYGISAVQLKDLKTFMVESLAKYPGITFFLDPKNLNAARAVGRVAMNNPDLASKIVMKTYSPFWSTTGAISHAAGDFWTITQGANAAQIAALRKMRVMPVDNEVAYLNRSDPDYGSALNDVTSDVRAWGSYMEVLSVELPGAYLGSNWLTFAQQVRTAMSAASFGLPWNSDSPGTSSPKLVPAISGGYRFDDFTLGNTTPYDWDMAGRPKPDQVNEGRRWVGNQLNFLHQASPTQSVYITTDNPVEEVYCILHGVRAVRSGAPVNRFANAFTPEGFDQFGDDGDQGGP